MKKDLAYYMGLDYPIETCRLSKEDGGGFFVHIPMLFGCMSDGETLEEAYKNIEECKREWFADCLELGFSIPEPCLFRDDEEMTDEEIRKIGENLLINEIGATGAKRYAELAAADLAKKRENDFSQFAKMTVYDFGKLIAAAPPPAETMASASN